MLIDRTHDISHQNFHVKDLDTFGEYLTAAATGAFPKGPSRYKEVHVLLLSWEEDTFGFVTEILELSKVFQQVYHYDVEEWRIPSDYSQRAVRKQIEKFLNEFEDKETLLIVYYGGRKCFIIPLLGGAKQH